MRQFTARILNSNIFETEALKDRVESAVGLLSCFGGEYQRPEDRDVILKNISDVVEDVAAALGLSVKVYGKLVNIVDGKVDVPQGVNVKQYDPEDKYVVKCYNRQKMMWTTLSSEHWQNSDSKLQLPRTGCVMTLAMAANFMNQLTDFGKKNCNFESDPIVYAVFPCNSIDRPKYEDSFNVKIKIEGANAEKIEGDKLRKFIEDAINHYIDEFEAPIFTSPTIDGTELSYSVKVGK